MKPKPDQSSRPRAKIVFFGNERLATGIDAKALILKSLIRRGYEVRAIVLNHKGDKNHSKTPEILKVAKAHNISVLQNLTSEKLLREIQLLKPDIGVLVAHGQIITQPVMDLFPLGIVNLHPSLLPKHRGPTPIESVILNGDYKTGVSLMRLAQAMDAGPVYAQSEVNLIGQESKQELSDLLHDLGEHMVAELLPGIISGNIIPLPQEESAATYDSLISKADGVINWNHSAQQIERQIRAYAGWPGSRTVIAGKQIAITRASVVDDTGLAGSVKVSNQKLIIHCGEKSLLIEQLKPAGKKEMDAKAFLAGYSKFIPK